MSRTNLTISVDADKKKEVQRIIEENKITLSDIVDQAFESFIEQYNNSKGVTKQDG